MTISYSRRPKAAARRLAGLALLFAAHIPLSATGAEPADAYFEVKFLFEKQTTIVVRATNPPAIQQARDILAGRAPRGMLFGTLVKAPAFYDPRWPFHVDPATVRFVETATEVCDAAPETIAEHLSEVGGSLLPRNTWCPWRTELAREVPAPADASRYLTNVSGANFSAAHLTPGAITSAFGVNLAREAAAASGQPLPLTLGGLWVTVKDSAGAVRPAGLLFVSPGQVNYVMPDDLAPGPATVVLTTESGAIVSEQVYLEPVAPTLFTAESASEGTAAGWIYRMRADGTFSFEPLARYDSAAARWEPVPIDLGPESDQLFLTIVGTGLRNRPSVEAVRVSFIPVGGGTVEYAGAQPEYAGLDQVNVKLARELAGQGQVDVYVTVDMPDRLLESNWVKLLFQ